MIDLKFSIACSRPPELVTKPCNNSLNLGSSSQVWSTVVLLTSWPHAHISLSLLATALGMCLGLLIVSRRCSIFLGIRDPTGSQVKKLAKIENVWKKHFNISFPKSFNPSQILL